MNSNIEKIINSLNLKALPEGGWYAETYRSEQVLGNTERNMLTSIYFLITSENVSRFHKIKSDELWYFHQGSTLTVHTLDENGHTTNKLGLNLEDGEKPYLLVKANTIFGSSIDSENGYALVSCAVAPGFDFRDFQLFTKEDLLKDFPENEDIIARLT